MLKLSIVVPCYNEAAAIQLFFEKVEVVIQQLPLKTEYIFVDDGSSDETLAVIDSLEPTKQSDIVTITFSRNFGKEAALYAGMEHASGDYVVIMDADLQDPPELLPQMLELIQNEGYDMVGSRRTDRKGEPWLRSFFSRMFYRIINKISKTEMLPGVRDYRMMTRQVVDSLLSLKEYHRFSKGIFSWIGYKTTYLPYENQARIAGETSWSIWNLFSYSLEAIINFSDFPLTVASFLGFFSCLGSGIYLLFVVIRTLLFGNSTSGWPSLVSIILFIGGLQLISLGIVGKYIGKIFLETKKRPIYIAKSVKKNSYDIELKSLEQENNHE